MTWLSTTPTKSAVAMILAARRRLREVCSPLALNGGGNSKQVESNFQEVIIEICTMITLACERNHDAALATTLLNQDGSYGIRHSVDTAMIAQTVGRYVGLPSWELDSITAAALTMNIGMLRVQDTFQIRKEPLTEHQRLALELHPQESADLLHTLGVTDELWIRAVLDHHEAFDGTGYPAKKRGDSLLMPARILALSDVYCARVSGRDYRAPLQPNAALRTIFLCQGRTVEAPLAAQFIKALGVFPPGTVVLLSNQEKGVVVQQGEKANAPTVCSVIGPNGNPLGEPVRRDTSNALYAIKSALDRNVLGGTVNMKVLWGTDGSSG